MPDTGEKNATLNMKNMSPLKLTRKEILNDIEVFKERIRASEEKIAALPQKANEYKERKKLKFKRRALEQEIKHVNGLIAIARGALNAGVEYQPQSQRF
jgi:chromosome segregation ATPase